jgi:hypothetical protein
MARDTSSGSSGKDSGRGEVKNPDSDQRLPENKGRSGGSSGSAQSGREGSDAAPGRGSGSSGSKSR